MPAYATFPASSGTNPGFNPLPFGGGGFVTGIDFSIDGLRAAITTDVGGAYIRDIGIDAKWRPALTTSSLDATEYGPDKVNNYALTLSDGDGVFAIAIAPSNKDHIILGYNGFVYRSTNGGAKFNRCNLPAKRMRANTKEQRMWQKKFVYHPTDTNRFLIGTNNDGVYFTLDGGASFTTVTSVPAGNMVDSNHAAHVCAIDGGDPNYVYVSRGGTGICRSTTGLVAGGFSHVTGGPSSARYMRVVDGTLYVNSVEGTFWKLARGSSTWVQITGWGAWGVYTFDVNPTDAGSIVVMGGDGELARTTNGGTSWVGDGRWFDTIPSPIGIYQNSDTYWLDGYVGSFYPAEIKFRPGVTNELWAAQGLGVSKSNPPTTYVRWDWHGEHAGIEELGFTKSLSIPGNARPLFLNLDKAIIRPKNLDASNTYPIFPGTTPGPKGGVVHGWDVDYAPEDPNYIAALINYFGDDNKLAGYSTDGGRTWAKFAAQHPDGSVGGCIAVTGVGKIIWVPGDGGKAVRSLDNGVSWQYINMGGSSGGIANWSNGIFIRRYIVTSDKTRPGHAAIIVNDSNQGIGGGVYKTSDNGTTWTNKFSGKIDSTGDGVQFWHNTLKYIPGKGSELLFCSGVTFPTSKFIRSTDDGASWTPVRGSEVTAVNFFDFGKAKTGQSYPVVFFDGSVNNVSGIYRSEDNFATTPELLGRFPLGEIVERSFIGGDMNRYGRMFAGLSGKGMIYGNFS